MKLTADQTERGIIALSSIVLGVLYLFVHIDRVTLLSFNQPLDIAISFFAVGLPIVYLLHLATVASNKNAQKKEHQKA